MKKTITCLFGILFLSLSMLNAQDVKSMNKKELREYITTLSDKVHSLEAGNLELLQSKNEISANSTTLEKKISVNNAEIKQLNAEIEQSTVLLEQGKIDLDIQISQHEITVSTLNDSISILRDSILNIDDLDDPQSNGDDFLNKYYFDQIPLPDNSYQLVLSKIVFGNTDVGDEYNYNNDKASEVLHLPEILDGKAFHYWTVKPNVKRIQNSENKDYLRRRNQDYFNSKFPKIEVLKNKLFTILYNDGSEESFLFNVTDCVHNNNQREVVQIDLANEEVENNKSKDIVWRIFAIENECYIALTYSQIKRFKLDLYNFADGIEVSYLYYESLRTGWFKNSDYYDKVYTTTGKGIFLSRKKDSYMDESQYINPENLIFLLKLQSL